MKKNIGPAAIGVAVVALAALMYFLYNSANPSPLNTYDPKNGPPDYVKNMKNGGSQSGYYGAGGAPGKAAGPAPNPAATP